MEPGDLSFGVVYVHCRDSFYFSMMYESHPALHGFELEWVEDADSPRLTLEARRMNLGNLGRAAVVRMTVDVQHLMSMNNISGVHSAIMQFAEVLTDVAATDSGDRVMEFGTRTDLNALCHESSADYEVYDLAPAPAIKRTKRGGGLISWMQRGMEKMMGHAEERCARPGMGSIDLADEGEEDDVQYRSKRKRDPLGEQEERETLDIEEEKLEALEQLKRAVLQYVIVHKKDPTSLIQEFIQGKYVIGTDGLSPLVVNGDLEIVLPGYDEVCVRMPALCRAIYILFLQHRHDGILLKQFADHRREFEQIYAVVMPGRDERRAAEAIDNLCNPLSNTLQEYLSRIKRCFATVLADKELLARYAITGQRGKEYRIQLPDDLVTLPRAITA